MSDVYVSAVSESNAIPFLFYCDASRGLSSYTYIPRVLQLHGRLRVFIPSYQLCACVSFTVHRTLNGDVISESVYIILCLLSLNDALKLKLTE